MFGTLRPPRLSEADRMAFRAHYCAGCHALREFGGRPLSLLTTYDQTFALLLLDALRDDDPESANAGAAENAVDRAPCTALPFRTVRVQRLPAALRAQVSAVSVLLADAKLADDVDDRSIISRPLFRGGRTLLARPADRARQLIGDHPLAHRIAALPVRQLEIEADATLAGDRRLDALSAPTRDVLAELFSYLGRLAVTADASGEPHPADATLRQLGNALGEAIYLFDAVDDVERDGRRGRFNALTSAWGNRWPLESTAARLTAAIDDAISAINALPLDEGDAATRTRRSTMVAILHGFRMRAIHTLGARNTSEPLPAHLVSQAGDCDLDCCCPCDSCSCGESVGCSSGDEAAEGCFCCVSIAEHTYCDCCSPRIPRSYSCRTDNSSRGRSRPPERP
ncbi:MAG: DUF5685 family protein, partial [Planctomycetota bacterium]